MSACCLGSPALRQDFALAATAGEVFKIKEYPLGASSCARAFLYAVSVMEASKIPAPSTAAPQRGRTALMVAAVACAVLGLASLIAVLMGAWLQGSAWPGFVYAAFLLLPLGFVLMVALVLGAVITRRRS